MRRRRIVQNGKVWVGSSDNPGIHRASTKLYFAALDKKAERATSEVEKCIALIERSTKRWITVFGNKMIISKAEAKTLLKDNKIHLVINSKEITI